MPAKNNDLVFGFHTRIGDKEGAGPLCDFVSQGLVPLGVNTLIVELNPGYNYKCFPKYATGSFDGDDAKQVLAVCRQHEIKVIPLFQCLSHQSNYKGKPWPLYLDHPELLETPDVPHDATWPEFYCHSWCASNDDVYTYILPMMDEVADVFEADTVHIGMDEIFDIGEDVCPRCAGKNKAELLAHTISRLYRHLKKSGRKTMMWGDRLLDAQAMLYHMWEADRLGMYPALEDRESVSREIIITDWHYDQHAHGYPSIDLFIREGFTVIPTTFNKPEQAKHLLGYMRDSMYIANKIHSPGRVGGFMCTHWAGFNAECYRDLMLGIQGASEGNGAESYIIGRVLAASSAIMKKIM